MIQELLQPVIQGEVQPQPIQVEGNSQSVDASNILVADHLQQCGYDYTLSVFYPESGLTREKVFTMEDLLELIQVSPHSSLYKSLISGFDKENNKGFIVHFLKDLAANFKPKEQCHVGTQTSLLLNKDSLAEKFQRIDDQFSDTCVARPQLGSLETKLNEYKREIEEQLRIEMNEKLIYLKETEIAKIKMEERRKFVTEFTNIRREFEQSYQVKSEAMLSQERKTAEKIQRQHEFERREIFAERQVLLKDMATLREREEELRKRIEAFELTQKLKDEERKSMTEAITKREQQLKMMEDSYDEKLKNEIIKYQLELKTKYIAKSNQLIEDEKRYQERASHLEKELSNIKSNNEELSNAKKRAKELELELETARAQVRALTEQNRKLNDKAKCQFSYSMLKEENLSLQAQNRRLQQDLVESRNENTRILNQIARSSEVRTMPHDLPRSEMLDDHPRPGTSSESGHRSMESHRQKLHRKLQSELENSVKLKSKLLNYDSSVKKLTAQVTDLKLHLRETQAALENEMFQNPKEEKESGSAGELTSTTLPLNPDTSGHPQDQNNLGEATASTEKGVKSHNSHAADLDFMTSTKSRMKTLEEEAEKLEVAFQNYNIRTSQQMANSIVHENDPDLILLMQNMPASHRRHALEGSRLWSESFPGNQMGEVPAITAMPSRRRSIASRHLSSLPLLDITKSLEEGLYQEGNAPSYGIATDPCMDSMLRASPLAAEDNSANHSLEAGASGFQRPSELEDNNEFPNLDDLDVMDREEFDSFEYGRNFPGPFDSVGFYPAGDMPQLDSTIAIHPAGDMSYMDSAATAASFHYTKFIRRLWCGLVLYGTFPKESQLELIKVVLKKDSEEERFPVETSGCSSPCPERSAEQREEEERLWAQQMRERRLKEEKRHSERQEALEKERRELNRLEEERKFIEKTLNLKIEEESEASEPESKEESASGASPLDKYMKIIQKTKEEEDKVKKAKKKTKENSEVDAAQSSDKDGSFTGFSHEEVDDFW
ncbi:centriole and centriolar satellite protein OFD1 [Suncus etruscus]|uniref:centriole and centriolar satellite protein OFD1 n=1 Tax=Suncus etruscus TaxID=109475 RepID=UPI00211003B1|nr:centriole and centriolar satellite protein OFD1 [Suncus etruscus]